MKSGNILFDFVSSWHFEDINLDVFTSLLILSFFDLPK